MYHYLNPGPKQQTNIRIRALMDAVLRQGMHVQLDALRIGRLTINDEHVPPDAFADRELRRLVENWMVLVHRRDGSLNA